MFALGGDGARRQWRGLGRAVLQNRAAKVLGTLVWTHYARRLENDQARVPPKRLLALLSVVAGACALWRSRAAALTRLPLAIGVFQLVLASRASCTHDRLRHDAADAVVHALWRQQSRTHVAILNAGFTLGALLTPMVVAVSMKLGFDAWPCFASMRNPRRLNAAALLLVPPPPTAPRKDDATTAMIRSSGSSTTRRRRRNRRRPPPPLVAPRRRDGVIVGGMTRRSKFA